MGKKLFSDFQPVSSKQWKQKIQFDLKGADYNETLIWNTNEDIAVKPFYHADEFNELPPVSNTKASQWKICQSIFVAHVEKSNLNAIDAIERGAESILFTLPNEDISIEDLLKNIDLDNIIIHFEPQFLSDTFVKKIANIPSKAGIRVHTDIINHLAKSGNWFNNLNDDFKKFETIAKSNKSFTIDVSLYQNAGATMVQQLAYALAHANEYLNYIYENPSLRVIFDDKSIEKSTIIFKVSVGSNYFFEIAKLRALRKLWSALASEYGINSFCNIVATPTKRNKTIYDYNTNMLRTTTECMSAILGGANTICNLAYDAIYHKTNEFGERIARNQLLILKHESYFNQVDNPADGTYYIESLTNQLTEKTLDLFKNIETNGGFLKQLKEGTIQRKIKESANKEQQQFDTGDEVLLGTNKHPNTNDRMKNDLEIYPFVKTNQRKTLIEPIIDKRLAEKLEQKRLKNET
ncbi:methylmalonyl-CoA mutase subunit beta [Sabulilitoribacter multivorans]|uniref:Methylmalonyl-CoA mutase subunit beta n=1 Tax=Flaviramulus multivorans TaxID=1304750 RepID=A0ABS9IKB2_9FLAO|nr:methylmalonyl-CoA mutase subunit beta [Flaviramulus multivorans]MCF7561040.1 methylmalonyl-CoA mutase subunit beta [Flaviramulus multivorans]